MNSAALAQSAYGATQTPVRTDRSVEYQAFAKVTRAMSEKSTEAASFVDTIAAVHENRRLWHVLAADVSSDDNALPVDLRAGILSLSHFVARHSSAVLKGDADIEPLIDINTMIMRGLRGIPEVR